jgi:hypothetical protein
MKSRSFTFGPALAGVAYKDIKFTPPGGGLMPHHIFINPGDDYRYGFNGKENDAELAWQDYDAVRYRTTTPHPVRSSKDRAGNGGRMQFMPTSRHRTQRLRVGICSQSIEKPT